jgi:acyl-CoA thioester hydrolase
MLKSHDIDFTGLSKRGINLVVIRIEIDYKIPLRDGEEFEIITRMSQISRLKVGFEQTIVRSKDYKIVSVAKVTGVALDSRMKPIVFPAIKGL